MVMAAERTWLDHWFFLQWSYTKLLVDDHLKWQMQQASSLILYDPPLLLHYSHTLQLHGIEFHCIAHICC